MVVRLIAFLMVLMASVAVLAIWKGKDGIITSAVCTAMTAAVTTILVGGLRKHGRSLKDAANAMKGGDSNGN